MMFGTREEFDYFICGHCGCLQIREIPSDQGKFYLSNYYSFNFSPEDSRISPLYIFLQKQRCKTAMFSKGYKISRLLSSFIKFPTELHIRGPVIRRAGVKSFDVAFLDVGCGNASVWLIGLKKLGFTNLLGIDPFISSDTHSHGITVLKKNISELSGQFSLITFHHSFEHVSEQLETLIQAKKLLAPGGVCLLRIPIVSSYVWEKYGVNWVEMDPPRHLYLHSNKSIELLAKKAGLELFDVVYDSMEFEFYGSEQYAADIPLTVENSYLINPEKSIFTSEQMEHFKEMAKKVNFEKTGGRAGFYFRRRL